MLRDLRIAILEPDLFARQWISQLIVRDWRTTLVAEFGTAEDFLSFLKKPHSRTDLVFLDVESPVLAPRLTHLVEVLNSSPDSPRVICLGIQGNEHALKQLSPKINAGYLLKDEIRHGLCWAASLAAEGKWVCTPGIRQLGAQIGFAFPPGGLVMDGRHWVHQFTDRELEVARMAVLFSVDRHDLADELDISDDYGYSVVSAIYKKLGLDAILSGEEDPRDYLGNNELLLSYFKRIIAGLKHSSKARDMETLAFHILTMPEVSELGR